MRVRPGGGVQQDRIGQAPQARRVLRPGGAVHDHVGSERAARGVRVGQLGAQDRIRRGLLYR